MAQTQKYNLAIPEVGIFWLMPSGKLLQCSLPYNEGLLYDKNIVSPIGHAHFWEQMRPHVPAIGNLEYDAVPRGRVSLRTVDDLFIVFCNNEFIQRDDIRRKIVQAFHLENAIVAFEIDEHYTLM